MLNREILPSGVPTLIFRYRPDPTSQAGSDPGRGLIRWNTTEQLDATELYIDWLTVDGFDVQIFVLANPIIGFVIQEEGFALNYQEWQLSAPAENMPDWIKVSATLISGDFKFTNKQQVISIILFSEGIPGPVGPIGPIGPMGPIGVVTPQSVTKCKDCLFWAHDDDPQITRGHCRRRAPLASRDQITTFWPQTQETDWCAEGLLKEVTPPEVTPIES
jgi:hypothetical protein